VKGNRVNNIRPLNARSIFICSEITHDSLNLVSDSSSRLFERKLAVKDLFEDRVKGLNTL
jgi:hypothetical protein